VSEKQKGVQNFARIEQQAIPSVRIQRHTLEKAKKEAAVEICLPSMARFDIGRASHLQTIATCS
jgi:hypothetical protein